MKIYYVVSSKSNARYLNEVGVKNIMSSFGVVPNIRALLDELAPRGQKALIDSGAFSVHRSGKVMHLSHYCAAVGPCKNHKAMDGFMMLDVISSRAGTINNFRKMKAQGLNPYFVEHIQTFGNKRAESDRVRAGKPKLAIGGMAAHTRREFGISIDKVLHNCEEIFKRADKYGVRKVHCLACYTPRIVTKFPWASLDTSTWLVGQKYGRILAFRRAKDGQIDSSQSWLRDYPAKEKERIMRIFRRFDWDPSTNEGRTRYNVYAMRLYEKYLNLRKSFDEWEELVLGDFSEILFTKQELTGAHDHPHEPNGVHSHPGLPPTSGGHSHPSKTPRMFDPGTSEEDLTLLSFGGHRHRPDDPLEGVHIGTFGNGEHVHPVAQGMDVELGAATLAQLHLTRPWLDGFVRAMIRERATPEDPWGEWRIWNRLDGLLHALHPQHQPKTNVLAHSKLFMDDSPEQLIQKRYEFKDGTVRAPQEADYAAEAKWLADFAKQGPDAMEKAFHLRGTHWIIVPKDGTCPVSHPNKLRHPDGEMKCYTDPAARALRAFRETQKQDPGTKGKFVLQRRFWRVREVVREGPTKQFWHVRFDWGKRFAPTITLEGDPARAKTTTGLYDPQAAKRKFEQEGTFTTDAVDDPKPQKVGTVTIERQDEGEAEVIEVVDDPKTIVVGLAGKILQGRYRVRDEGGGVWSFEKLGARLKSDAPAADDKGQHDTVRVFAPIVHFEEKTVVNKRGQPEEQRLIYGVVYAPFIVDAQNDWADTDAIQRAAHRWMIESRNMKLMHRFNTDKLKPVESFIAPADFRLGGKEITKGTWVLVSKVFDDAIWRDVKAGKLTGYSLGGRSSVREEAPPRA